MRGTRIATPTATTTKPRIVLTTKARMIPARITSMERMFRSMAPPYFSGGRKRRVMHRRAIRITTDARELRDRLRSLERGGGGVAGRRLTLLVLSLLAGALLWRASSRAFVACSFGGGELPVTLTADDDSVSF